MTANSAVTVTASCPDCGRAGLHIEHVRTVSFEFDFAGPLGQRGHVCPVLRVVDEGEVDERGNVAWHDLRVLDSDRPEGALDDGDDVPAPAGHTVHVHGAELHESTIVLRCPCGWSRSEDLMPPDQKAIFERLRALAASYRVTS